MTHLLRCRVCGREYDTQSDADQDRCNYLRSDHFLEEVLVPDPTPDLTLDGVDRESGWFPFTDSLLSHITRLDWPSIFDRSSPEAQASIRRVQTDRADAVTYADISNIDYSEAERRILSYLSSTRLRNSTDFPATLPDVPEPQNRERRLTNICHINAGSSVNIDPTTTHIVTHSSERGVRLFEIDIDEVSSVTVASIGLPIVTPIAMGRPPIVTEVTEIIGSSGAAESSNDELVPSPDPATTQDADLIPTVTITYDSTGEDTNTVRVPTGTSIVHINAANGAEIQYSVETNLPRTLMVGHDGTLLFADGGTDTFGDIVMLWRATPETASGLRVDAPDENAQPQTEPVTLGAEVSPGGLEMMMSDSSMDLAASTTLVIVDTTTGPRLFSVVLDPNSSRRVATDGDGRLYFAEAFTPPGTFRSITGITNGIAFQRTRTNTRIDQPNPVVENTQITTPDQHDRAIENYDLVIPDHELIAGPYILDAIPGIGNSEYSEQFPETLRCAATKTPDGAIHLVVFGFQIMNYDQQPTISLRFESSVRWSSIASSMNGGGYAVIPFDNTTTQCTEMVLSSMGLRVLYSINMAWLLEQATTVDTKTLPYDEFGFDKDSPAYDRVCRDLMYRHRAGRAVNLEDPANIKIHLHQCSSCKLLFRYHRSATKHISGMASIEGKYIKAGRSVVPMVYNHGHDCSVKKHYIVAEEWRPSPDIKPRRAVKL